MTISIESVQKSMSGKTVSVDHHEKAAGYARKERRRAPGRQAGACCTFTPIISLLHACCRVSPARMLPKGALSILYNANMQTRVTIRRKIIGGLTGRYEVGNRDAVHAVIASREGVPPVDDGPDERAQGYLEHAEVELGQADADKAHDEAEHGSDERPDDEAEPRRKARSHHDEGRPVCTDAVEDRMVKLVESAVAEGQIADWLRPGRK